MRVRFGVTSRASPDTSSVIHRQYTGQVDGKTRARQRIGVISRGDIR
jgi:hypothetical protein